MHVKTINIARFQHIAEVLKNDIISGNSRSFSVSDDTRAFLAEAEIKKLKAKSIHKSDIFATLIDPRTSVVREEVGFSIKSEFGKEPTIFNTAPASGAKYKVSNMSDTLMNDINNIVDVKGNATITDRCRRLMDSGCELEFVGYPIAKRAGEEAFLKI